MTVTELIKKLQTVPPDARVFCGDADGEYPYELGDIVVHSISSTNSEGYLIEWYDKDELQDAIEFGHDVYSTPFVSIKFSGG